MEESSSSSSKYLKGKILGEGTWGHVYEATCQADGGKVAIKRIKPRDVHLGVNFTALREIKYLKEVHSPFVVNLIDVFLSEGILHLVLEFCPHNLEDIIRDKSILIRSYHVKSYVQMMLSGLDCLHKNYILHRDLKPANLLIGSNGQLKIADFGLARCYGSPNPMTAEVVSLWYRAPELLFGARFYGAAVDMWAAGCILAEIILRTALFPGEATNINQLAKIFNVMGTPQESDWPGVTLLPNFVEFEPREPLDLKPLFRSRGSDGTSQQLPLDYDLLMRLLQLNPNKRMTAGQALLHHYFHVDPLPSDPMDLPIPGGATKRPASAAEGGTSASAAEKKSRFL